MKWIGRKQEDEDRSDENRLDEKWVYRWVGVVCHYTTIRKKMNNISKTNNRKTVKFGLNPFQNIAHRLGQKKWTIFHTILRIFYDHISITRNWKNRKIYFPFILEHCATLLTKNPILVRFEGAEVCMSLTSNNAVVEYTTISPFRILLPNAHCV